MNRREELDSFSFQTGLKPVTYGIKKVPEVADAVRSQMSPFFPVIVNVSDLFSKNISCSVLCVCACVCFGILM